jgi:hypothetical protein
MKASISETELLQIIHQANADLLGKASWQTTALDLSTMRTLPLVYVKHLALFEDHQICLGIDDLPEDLAHALAQLPFSLDFPNLKTLEPRAAESLGQCKATWLSLSGLESISPEAIRALLVNFKEMLSLGLTELSEEVAKEFVGISLGTLDFVRLKAMSKEVAFWLNQTHAILHFEALESLAPDAAEILLRGLHHPVDFEKLDISTPELAMAIAQHSSDLHLSGVSHLTPDIAEVLMGHKGYFMSLYGIKKIDAKTAEKLRLYGAGEEREITPHVSLGLEEIDADTARVFAQIENVLCLHGVKSISDDVANVLSTAKCTAINLNEEVAMSEFARDAVFKFRGELSIRDGVTNL